MLVRSANTAVICAKPFRENDRVDSSPGIPASAVSSATVTCFSISTGVSAGAVAFTWTWTLVTSGTASIGSFVRDHKPDAAATRVTSRTSHLRRIEKSTILSIIVSVLVAGLRQFRLQRERVRNGHGFAGREPRNDLDGLAIALAEDNVTLLEPVLGADEHGLAALDRLDGTERRDDGDRALIDRDRSGDERSGPPAAVGILDGRDDARGPRILVEQGADEHDLAGRRVRKAPQRHGDRLSFPDHRQVGR